MAFLTFLSKVTALAILQTPIGAAICLLVLFLGHLCEATTFAAYEVQDRRLAFACDRDLCDTCAGPNTTGTCYNTRAPPLGPKCSPETLCATPIAGGCRQDVMCRPGTYRLADAGRFNFVDVISLDGFEIRAWSAIDSSTTPFSCSGAFWSTRKTGLQQVTAAEPLVCVSIGLPSDYIALLITAATNTPTPMQSRSMISSSATSSALNPINSSAQFIQDDAAKAGAVAGIGGIDTMKPTSPRPFIVNNVTDSAQGTQMGANDLMSPTMAPPEAAPTANLTMNIGPDGEVLFDIASVCKRRMPPSSSMTSIENTTTDSTTSASMTSTTMDSTTITSMSRSASSFPSSVDPPKPTDPAKDAGPGSELSGNAEAGAAGAAAGANGAAGVDIGAGLVAGAAAGAAVAGAVAGAVGGGGPTSSGPSNPPNSALPSTPVPSVNVVVPVSSTVSLAPSSSAVLSDIIPSSVATAAGAQVAQDINSIQTKSSSSALPPISTSSPIASILIPSSVAAAAGAKVASDINSIQTNSPRAVPPPPPRTSSFTTIAVKTEASR